MEPGKYEIRIGGSLGSQGREWFDGFSIRVEDGRVTVLEGLIIDEASLYGVLSRIRDLNLPLISINPVADAPKGTE